MSWALQKGHLGVWVHWGWDFIFSFWVTLQSCRTSPTGPPKGKLFVQLSLQSLPVGAGEGTQWERFSLSRHLWIKLSSFLTRNWWEIRSTYRSNLLTSWGGGGEEKGSAWLGLRAECAPISPLLFYSPGWLSRSTEINVWRDSGVMRPSKPGYHRLCDERPHSATRAVTLSPPWALESAGETYFKKCLLLALCQRFRWNWSAMDPMNLCIFKN